MSSWTRRNSGNVRETRKETHRKHTASYRVLSHKSSEVPVEGPKLKLQDAVFLVDSFGSRCFSPRLQGIITGFRNNEFGNLKTDETTKDEQSEDERMTR